MRSRGLQNRRQELWTRWTSTLFWSVFLLIVIINNYKFSFNVWLLMKLKAFILCIEENSTLCKKFHLGLKRATSDRVWDKHQSLLVTLIKKALFLDFLHDFLFVFVIPFYQMRSPRWFGIEISFLLLIRQSHCNKKHQQSHIPAVYIENLIVPNFTKIWNCLCFDEIFFDAEVEVGCIPYPIRKS